MQRVANKKASKGFRLRGRSRHTAHLCPSEPMTCAGECLASSVNNNPGDRTTSGASMHIIQAPSQVRCRYVRTSHGCFRQRCSSPRTVRPQSSDVEPPWSVCTKPSPIRTIPSAPASHRIHRLRGSRARAVWQMARPSDHQRIPPVGNWRTAVRLTLPRRFVHIQLVVCLALVYRKVGDLSTTTCIKIPRFSQD